jgi:hypothetical protein
MEKKSASLQTEVYIPDGSIETPLSNDTIASFKVNRAHQITAVFGNWGQKVDNSEFMRATGFDELFQTPGYYSRKQAIDEELTVLFSAIPLVLDCHGMSSEDISFVVVASGSPITDDYAGEITTEFGFANVQHTLNIYTACNSGALALDQAYKLFRGQRGLFIAIDGLTGVRRPAQPYENISDPASRRIFSNGFAFFAVEIGTGIDFLPLVVESNPQNPIDRELQNGLIVRPDTKGVIRAHMTYNQLLRPDGDIVQVVGNTTCVRLLEPSNGRSLEMNPNETAKFFSAELLPLLERVLELYLLNINPHATEITILLHHATRLVNTMILRSLKTLLMKNEKLRHLRIHIPWLSIFGNSSGATFPIVLAYYLKQIEPGQDVICASMGAGATFTFLCPVFL